MIVLDKDLDKVLNHVVWISYAVDERVDEASDILEGGVGASLAILCLLIEADPAHFAPEFVVERQLDKPLHLDDVLRVNDSLTIIFALVDNCQVPEVRIEALVSR